MMIPDWAEEVAHWPALLPIVVLLLYWPRRGMDASALLISCAFALSWVADSAGAALADNGISNLWLTYMLAPVQFGILLRAVRPKEGGTVVALFFALLVAVSLLRGTYDAPETVVHAIAGGFVCFIIFGHRDMARYRTAVIVYCGAAIPFLLAMGALDPVSDPWAVAWIGYQLCRVTALLLMTHAVWSQPRMRLEVITDEPRDNRATEGPAAGHRGRLPDRWAGGTGMARASDPPPKAVRIAR